LHKKLAQAENIFVDPIEKMSASLPPLSPERIGESASFAGLPKVACCVRVRSPHSRIVLTCVLMIEKTRQLDLQDETNLAQ